MENVMLLANRLQNDGYLQSDSPGLGSAAAAAVAASGTEDSAPGSGVDFPDPHPTMTITEFVERFFVPEHVARKASSGRTHYQAILKHVLVPEEVNRVFRIDAANSRIKLKALPNWPYVGGLRLCDAEPEHVQRLVAAAIARGYSSQTVVHIRNVVSAVFAHARKRRCFDGENPAALVKLPAMTRKVEHTLTLAQARDVLQLMRYPEKEITLIAILTRMNVSEICGLQWKFVNLSEEWRQVDGETIPPRSIAVRMEWSRGKLNSVGQKSRQRILTIPPPLLPILSALRDRLNHTGPDDFVISSSSGRPISQQNIAARRLKPIGQRLQMPWLSWHTFRRTHTTLAYELGTQFLGDGVAGSS
jgi:integrase